MRMLKAISLLVLVLAGCSVEPAAPPATGTVAAPEAATPPAPAAEPPILPIASGGRPDPVLANETEPALQPPPVQPLSQADFEGRIDSGLGCSFESADGQTLLVATAPADAATRAEGVVKIGGQVQLLRAGKAGGYQALAAGQSLTNAAGWSAFVRRGSGAGRSDGTESTSWPANLIVAMEGGGSVTFENGRWSCGA